MGRPTSARQGHPVKNTPAGFPLFFDRRKQRIVTADPWAFLSQLAVTKLKKNREAIALAYIQQGHEFFEAAQNPRLNSRPLLYYYAFLNVVKAALLIRGIAIPAAAKHGISDPRANSRKRLRLEGQLVRITGCVPDQSEILPEFMSVLGHSDYLPRSFRIVNLLRLVPSIHRTFVTVEGCPPTFVPIKKIDLLHASSKLWARIQFDMEDKDVVEALPDLRARQAFSSCLSQVESSEDGRVWFETVAVAAKKRGFDTAISKLAWKLRAIGVGPILTAQGYRFYFANTAPRDFVPYLAAVYCIAFYLGSVTRYKPDVFDKIISGRHSWVIAEFLATQPTQFLYALASDLAGVDVVGSNATIA
jgi:hypothetical protein